MAERLRCERLTVHRGGLPVIVDLSHTFTTGIVALLGRNGAGKSTLLRALAGVITYQGTITVDGHDLRTAPEAARAALGWMPETPELFPWATPEELLASFAAIRGSKSDGEPMFCELIGASRLRARVGTLSSGQRRKLALVLALAAEPPVLLLDEPTDMLDAAARGFLSERLHAHRDNGGLAIVASHRPHELGVPIDETLELDPPRAVV